MPEYELLVDAATRPHVRDNAAVENVLRVYHDANEDLWLYHEQLTRRATGELT